MFNSLKFTAQFAHVASLPEKQVVQNVSLLSVVGAKGEVFHLQSRQNCADPFSLLLLYYLP